jgi:hypothetical protein
MCVLAHAWQVQVRLAEMACLIMLDIETECIEHKSELWRSMCC